MPKRASRSSSGQPRTSPGGGPPRRRRIAREDHVAAVHRDGRADLVLEDPPDAAHHVALGSAARRLEGRAERRLAVGRRSALMASTSGWASSVHSASSLFVTVTKFGREEDAGHAANGEEPRRERRDLRAPGPGKCALAPARRIGSPSTHLMLFGFGVRSACMRKPRSIDSASGGSSRG